MSSAPDPHQFVFEIDVAIRTQVIQKLEASPILALARDVAPPLKGVYALYWQKKLVYAGKALHTTLKRRLKEHARKIADYYRSEVSRGLGASNWLTASVCWLPSHLQVARR